MNKVAIITDNAVAPPEEQVAKYDITLVYDVIILKDKEYRCGIDITVDEFMSRFEEFQELATTTGPPIPEYLDAYRSCAQRAKDILCLTVTSKVSAMTLNAAQTARELVQDELPGVNIEIFDTASAGGGHALITLAAARAVEEGKSLPEVIKAAERARSETEYLMVFDTLEYLVKRGRAPKAASWTSTALNVKPLTRTIEGEFRPLERVRSRRAGLRKMVEFMEQEVGERRVRVGINHAQSLEDAKWLEEEVSSRFNCLEMFITPMTSLVTLYTGPGLVGLGFCPEEVG